MYYTCYKAHSHISNSFLCHHQPALMQSRQRRHKVKDEGRQRGDRDTNRGSDKSQHAEKQYTAAPGSARVASWNSFIWSGASISGSHRESLLSCFWARRSAGWLAGRKSLLCGSSSMHGSTDSNIWIQFALSTLTLTRLCQGGISALWFPLPKPALIVIPHYLVKGGGMNHKLLQRNDIFLHGENSYSASHLCW